MNQINRGYSSLKQIKMIVGKIESLWRFPVKSFQGEKLDKAEIGHGGLLGDRTFALIDTETGKVVSATNVKLFPDLLMCKASYLEPPKLGKILPPVQITLANGKTTTSDSKNVNQTLTEFFARDVKLAQGAESKFPMGSFMDVFPLSVITTSSLDYMQELRPETNFDPRRFRMNVIVRTEESGFVENEWIEKSIKLGNGAAVRITMPDPRCVMTTLPQEGLPKDNYVLRTLANHNRLNIKGEGKLPCAGVYAIVENSGVIRVDDRVEMI